jgi:hypothetical protein
MVVNIGVTYIYVLFKKLGVRFWALVHIVEARVQEIEVLYKQRQNQGLLTTHSHHTKLRAT